MNLVEKNFRYMNSVLENFRYMNSVLENFRDMNSVLENFRYMNLVLKKLPIYEINSFQLSLFDFGIVFWLSWPICSRGICL